MHLARLHCPSIFAFTLCAALAPLSARAEIITYTVDPTRSSLTISGTFAGNTLQPESGVPGSLTTSYTGTISANRDFLADTLQITGGNIAAQTNGTVSPVGISYGIGSSYPPADYAFITGAGFNPPATGSVGALLGLSFSLTTPLISPAADFDASLFSAAISGSEFDYASTDPDVIGTTFPISGSFALAPGTVSLTEADDAETLFVPVIADFTLLADGQPLEIHFSGSIVATAEVPEPASLALLATSALVFLCRPEHGTQQKLSPIFPQQSKGRPT